MRSSLIRWILTLAILCAAAVYAYTRYRVYFEDPWTRDAMVQADVLDLACQVSGPVQHIFVHDNMFVHQGDVIFTVEDTPFKLDADRALGELHRAQAVLHAVEQERNTLLAAGKTGIEKKREQTENALTEARAELDIATAACEQARRHLANTRVLAPADGYVVNLRLQPGSLVAAYKPVMALIVKDSFRVDAFFRESLLAGFAPGDSARVTLMTYPDQLLSGEIESIGRGIARQNGVLGPELLPRVSPTFEWIRLAQRIPVRIRLLHIPETMELRVGMTASVLVHDSRKGALPKDLPTVPQALQ